MHITKIPSPHFNERLYPLNALIIHYTDMRDEKEALTWLTHPASQVSAHYLIDKSGNIYQLVEDDKRAWHAGESFWQGQRDMNSCSLGIELCNPGHTYGLTPFPDPQIHSLINLALCLKERWEIPPDRILGHSDIAPRRKQDPGALFPWKRLAQHSLGLWPLETSMPCKNLKKSLANLGYETASLSHTLLAFQRRFQPHKVDGVADTETLCLVQGLLDAKKNLI